MKVQSESYISKARLGKEGEELAKKFLEKMGYKLVANNFQTPYGELDLVMRKKNLLCFIEVKSRHSSYGFSAGEAITAKKVRNLSRSARFFLNRKKIKDAQIRFDFISVDFSSSPPQLEFFPGSIESPSNL